MDNFLVSAIIGANLATIGRFLEALIGEEFGFKRIVLFCEGIRECERVSVLGVEYVVLPINNENIVKNRADVAFFCCGEGLSVAFAPLFCALGCVVVDCSGGFLRDESVPIVVGGANPNDVFLASGIVACPDLVGAGAVCVLSCLNKRFGVKRVVFCGIGADFGAGFGAGFGADFVGSFSGFSSDGEVLENGYFRAENDFMEVVRRILNDSYLSITGTLVGAIKRTTERAIKGTVEGTIEGTEGVIEGQNSGVSTGKYAKVLLTVRLNHSCLNGDIVDCLTDSKIPVFSGLCLDSTIDYPLFVERIRRDPTAPDTFNLCINIHKDYAIKNAINIAKSLN